MAGRDYCHLRGVREDGFPKAGRSQCRETQVAIWPQLSQKMEPPGSLQNPIPLQNARSCQSQACVGCFIQAQSCLCLSVSKEQTGCACRRGVRRWDLCPK